ncbi:MAG: glycosyltransferase [Bacteroidales bacterium]|jgi:glycosyltransferase involved in cell wall biosynthesis|nr:glycosyltransferase [Bacteroidales bacterium]
MRIFVLSSGDIFTSRWTNSFTELGYEVHLLVQEPLNEEFNPKVIVHYLPFKRPWGAILNVPFLRRLIRKTKPDLLHVFSVSQDGLLGRLSGFHPSLVSVLGYDVFNVPDHSKLMRRIVVNNLKFYDWVGSTSNMMAHQIKLLYPRISRLTITPFGVDTEVFKPIADLKNDEFITIGTVKTMNHKYGIDILIRSYAKAFGLLSQSMPQISKKMRLLIVGGGPQLNELIMLTKELKIDGNVDFTGFIKNKKVPEYLNKMDIYVAMSRMKSESFGVAVVEASACALPVIVSDIGGLPEVVENGITGFLVESENVDETTEVLIKLIKDKDLREKMGNSGRKFVREKYEWSKCVDTMKNIYDRLILEKSVN